MRRFRGVTLTEALVVMVVVAALTAITIVSLQGARKKGDDLVDLNNLRLTLLDFASWSVEHDGAMLNVGPPDDPDAQWWYATTQGDPAVEESRYRAQAVQWPLVMHHWSGRTQEHWRSTEGPRDARGVEPDPEAIHDPLRARYLLSRFLYSPTMLTAAEIWTHPAPPVRYGTPGMREALRRVPAAAVAFPASKGVLLLDREAPNLGGAGAVLVGFADGRAAWLMKEDAKPTAINPWGAQDQRGRTVLSTLHGHKGADF